MKPLSAFAIALSLLVAGCGNDSSPTTPSASTNPIFTASLSPANEVPPVTNSESTVSGTATITLNTTRDSAGNVTSASAIFAVTLGGFPAGSTINVAHIHEGASTCACPVVVNTTLAAGQVTISNNLASFTRDNIPVQAAVAQRMIANPGGFYFNVHSTLNPGGVARGTLVKTN
jgi:CHRD domain-containing protein